MSKNKPVAKLTDQEIRQMLIEELHGPRFQAHNCPGNPTFSVHLLHAVCRVHSGRVVHYTHGPNESQLVRNQVTEKRAELLQIEVAQREYDDAAKAARNSQKQEERKPLEDRVRKARAVLDALRGK